MSYYALFQGWLLTLNTPLETLAVDLGYSPLDYEAYPSQSDCIDIHHRIRSLMGFGNPVRPLARSVLYPNGLNQYATPKDISERTSYHQIRLAFHPYPHLIQCFFNNN